MKDTKDSKKNKVKEKDIFEEQVFTYIEGLDIDDDFKALDIAGETYQAY